MTAEKVEHLPFGFRWKDIPEVGLSIPIKSGWRMDSDVLLNNRGPDMLRFVLFDFVDPHGNYMTSLTIDAARLHSSYGDESAEQYARHGLDEYGTRIKALSGVEAPNWIPPMVGSKRLFEEESNDTTCYERIITTFPRKMEAVRTNRYSTYVLNAANIATDTSYNIRFVTPATLWGEYRETAEIMVDNVILNKDF